MSKDKIIEMPEMEYWDDEQTKPKFKIGMYDNGNLYTLIPLNEAGEWDGLRTKWNKSGQKWEDTNYVNGKVHGMLTEWHDDGQKKSEENYVDGERHGFRAYHHASGKKQEEVNFKNRKKHGLHTYWYDNDQKMFEGNYVNGKKQGEWKFFDREGNLTKTKMYDENHGFSHEEVQPAM